MSILRISIATLCTVAGIIAIAYLAKILEINKSLIIPLSVITGFCGFVFGVYWAMTYIVKSGYAEKK